MKILPIEINHNYMKTECWTFERMAIIQTSEFSRAWVASHFNMYMDETFHPYIGVQNEVFSSQYYDDILIASKSNIMHHTKESYLEFIKESIDEGKYVFSGSNWNLDSTKDIQLHGSLIYGYDDEKETLFSAMVVNRIWKEIQFSYRHVQESLESIQKKLREKNERMFFATIFHCPLLAYRLRTDYNIDQCVYMAIRKIMAELEGEVCNREVTSDGTKKISYTGIECLNGLLRLLSECKSEGKIRWKELEDLSESLNKLYEYRRTIVISMRYIKEYWNIDHDALENAIVKYEESCVLFSKMYQLALKVEITKEEKRIDKLIDLIRKQYAIEKEVLNEFLEIINELYIKNDYF